VISFLCFLYSGGYGGPGPGFGGPGCGGPGFGNSGWDDRENTKIKLNSQDSDQKKNNCNNSIHGNKFEQYIYIYIYLIFFYQPLPPNPPLGPPRPYAPFGPPSIHCPP
jgi:hypothetical protein